MDKFNDINGRRVKLKTAAIAELNDIWQQWKDAPFNPYIKGRCTRKAYDETNRRGQRLVETQTKHGVWLIHPTNARAGLESDDPRIIG